MSEEINYILESLRFKTSIYRDKHKRNLTFNDDEYYSNILNEYIEDLQQENQIQKEQLKEMQMNKTDYTEVNILTMLNYKYKSVLDEIREYINNYDIFKEFSFPLMKRDEENQVKSSMDYEFQTSIKKSLLQILDKANPSE